MSMKNMNSNALKKLMFMAGRNTSGKLAVVKRIVMFLYASRIVPKFWKPSNVDL